MEKTDRYIGGNIDYIIMDEKDSWDIDEEEDFKIVEALMNNRKDQTSFNNFA